MSDSKANASNETKYFDLHMNGLGYLNRAREVRPKKGNPFLAVSISALHGSADEVSYTYIDCRVYAQKAQDTIQRLMDAINDKDQKVLVAFRVSDPYIDQFEYQSGERKGQAGAQLKARLLAITYAKVGSTVIELPTDEEANAPTDADTSAESSANEQAA